MAEVMSPKSEDTQPKIKFEVAQLTGYVSSSRTYRSTDGPADNNPDRQKDRQHSVTHPCDNI